ncbi:tyrosinase family protein (plasmid) [Mesorhizobium sp. AR10]|uniref:tyrosinase family protein n=1 Tax=Mesorhizobium sp. AR10 TaxID=2865839 RepID=UPI00215EF2F4|nr:tyrosinase family protein [Mesorhizobium sp. AR10]UVK35730.1 tyrosinase family protein [Mesorhizobium sp. AR10]
MRKKLAALVIFSILAAIMSVGGALADNPELRIRKNIDALKPEELSNYLHALDIVMRRDPSTVGSYAYYAALHNDLDVGPCEHATDTFLPWHRAHLYDFENELRASDPPRTSEVTIPYWNWSELPSGTRFPKAFETEALLTRKDRWNRPICKGAPDPSCDRLSFPWPELDADVLSVKSWSSPTEDNFGSFSLNQAVECKDRADGGYGALENPPHNTMHGSYIGGLMGNPRTAAEDPIYWSYHAFIDLLWWNWQQRANHVVDTCPTCKLCGLNWTVDKLVDSEAQLKVSYEFSPPPPVTTIASPGGMPEPLASVDMALSATEDPVGRHTSLVTIPSKKVEAARVTVQNVRIVSPVTFQVNAFFYPQSEAASFDPKDRASRERRIVYVGTIWQRHHGHDTTSSGLTQTFRVNLAPYLNALVAEHGGETWVLDVRTYVDPNSDSGMHGLTTDSEAIRGILEFGGVGLSIE